MNVNHAVRQDRKTLKSKGSEIVKPRRRPHASDKRQLTSLLDSGACAAGRGRQAYALYLAVSCVAPQRPGNTTWRFERHFLHWAITLLYLRVFAPSAQRACAFPQSLGARRSSCQL